MTCQDYIWFSSNFTNSKSPLCWDSSIPNQCHFTMCKTIVFHIEWVICWVHPLCKSKGSECYGWFECEIIHPPHQMYFFVPIVQVFTFFISLCKMLHNTLFVTSTKLFMLGLYVIIMQCLMLICWWILHQHCL